MLMDDTPAPVDQPAAVWIIAGSVVLAGCAAMLSWVWVAAGLLAVGFVASLVHRR